MSVAIKCEQGIPTCWNFLQEHEPFWTMNDWFLFGSEIILSPILVETNLLDFSIYPAIASAITKETPYVFLISIIA